jgi:hypothetical protein
MNPQFGPRIHKDYIGMVTKSKKESDRFRKQIKHSKQHIVETIVAKFFHVFPTERERSQLYSERQQVIESNPKSNFVVFNNRIDLDYIRMIKVDATSTNKAIDCVVETTIAKFFELFQTDEKREALYDEHLWIKKLKQNNNKMPPDAAN